MATAEAYRVLRDTNIPKALSVLPEEDLDGNRRYETQGVLYAAGDYVRRSDITPSLHERLDNGDLDDFLEPVDASEMDAALRAIDRAGTFSTFAPEHEVERVALRSYGHEVIPREQILQMNSAGSDAARESFESAVADGASDRPGITQAETFVEVPSLAEASTEGKTVLPVESEEFVDVESAQTMSSGVVGGAVKAAAEGADVSSSGESPKGSSSSGESRARTRKRPGQASDKSAQDQDKSKSE